MGIDVYLEWPGQEEENKIKDNQLNWCSTTQGHVGYLREAYHGGPYATKLAGLIFPRLLCENG